MVLGHVHSFFRNKEKTQKQLEERLAKLEEQKKLNEQAIEQQLERKELMDECKRKQAEFGRELDMVMEGKKKVAAEEQQKSQINDERINVYLNAKKV
jgi:uncharacterized protein HemX